MKRRILVIASMILILMSSIIANAAGKQIQWQYRDGKWYGYNMQGVLGHGWMKDGTNYYYLDAEGACLINTMTPDGYYVDTNGAWHQRSTEILGEVFHAPMKFPSAASDWTGEKALEYVQYDLDDLLETRKLRVSKDAVEYLAGTSKEEVVMGIYKNAENGSFRLELKMHLDQSSTKMDQITTYDYMIFRAMLHQLTSTPDLLEDAVYSSWEGDNRWDISRTEYRTVGDALVKYTAGNGYGCYNIYPATKQ